MRLIHAIIPILYIFPSSSFSPLECIPHRNGKEFHISRSFKVHNRRIISAWSPLATGIMSELWRHLACRERLRSRNPSSSFTRINQYVNRYLRQKIGYATKSWPEVDCEIPRGKARRKFFLWRECGKGIGHNDNTGFRFNGRNRRNTDVHAKATAVGYLPVFPLTKLKQVV